MRITPLVCATTLAWLVVGSAAAAPDWRAVADVETVVAITQDPGGETRETTIWLLVLDGEGYIRTSRSTSWGENVVRNPEISVRIGEIVHPFRIRFVEDAALRTRVVDGIREKYGWSDGLIGLFRGSDPHIMRLEPRP